MTTTVCVLSWVGCDTAEPVADASLFCLVSPGDSGISFVNQLTEGPNTNILVYEYFYNGGGVATGDFDGDGRPDLYFVANMAGNQLYLNRGKLKFEDVTAVSGAGGRPGPWKTGVAVTDINGDGLDDIYLSYSGTLPEVKRRNQLMVNQGNDPAGIPVFRDEAAAYGLDSPAFTNQTYFFDYDGDGDQDAILLNHNPKSLPILNAEQTRQLISVPDSLRGLRLYRNTDSFYTDVTESAGINGSALSYGLGLAISDLNQDGHPDFHVSNDYEVPDYLYLNNGDGTFTDRTTEVLGHTSHFSMGSDIADVNNDGQADIFTLDMLPMDNRRRKLLMADDNRPRHALNAANGYRPQTMRNMLHLNGGNGSFAEVGQQSGIAATDWSWSALLADLDNDGHKDLHVTNGYLRDYTNLDFIKYMDNFVAEKGRLQRTDVLELLQQMPASGVSNQAFRNRGDGTFSPATTDWGLERPSNSNGAIAVDLDGDGDLDLVTNNINQPAFIYRNNTENCSYLQVDLIPLTGRSAIGARVTVVTDSITQTQELYPNRGYLSSGPTLLHFGLGRARARVQKLLVTWPDGTFQQLKEVGANQLIRVEQGQGELVPERLDNTPNSCFAVTESPMEYRAVSGGYSDFDRQPLLPHGFSKQGPILADGDFDGDGFADVLVGSSGGQPTQLYLRRSSGEYGLAVKNGFEASAGQETRSLLGHDLDGDGDIDVYQANAGYHDFTARDARLVDRVWLNDGRGHFELSTESNLTNTSTGAVAFDHTAEVPLLFVGGYVVPGRYPEAAESKLIRREATGTFTDVTATLAPDLADLGIVTDATWNDLDGDGHAELIVVGQWMPITVFSLSGKGYVNVTERYFDEPTTGWWNALHVEDLNGDGRPDLIAGNEGDNNRYRVSTEHPAMLTSRDLDENGSVDPVLFLPEAGVAYADAGRDQLLAQLPQLRSVYTDYASYSAATGEDILRKLGISEPELRVVNQRTSLFLLGSDGKFTSAPLPHETQNSPVHTITVIDADGDGTKDLLFCGNELNARVSSGPSDANAGTLLMGDGQGGFRYLSQTASGLHLTGAVRSVVNAGDYLLFGVQQQSIQSYRINHGREEQ